MLNKLNKYANDETQSKPLLESIQTDNLYEMLNFILNFYRLEFKSLIWANYYELYLNLDQHQIEEKLKEFNERIIATIKKNNPFLLDNLLFLKLAFLIKIAELENDKAKEPIDDLIKSFEEYKNRISDLIKLKEWEEIYEKFYNNIKENDIFVLALEYSGHEIHSILNYYGLIKYELNKNNQSALKISLLLDLKEFKNSNNFKSAKSKRSLSILSATSNQESIKENVSAHLNDDEVVSVMQLKELRRDSGDNVEFNKKMEFKLNGFMDKLNNIKNLNDTKLKELEENFKDIIEDSIKLNIDKLKKESEDKLNRLEDSFDNKLHEMCNKLETKIEDKLLPKWRCSIL